MNEAFEVFGYDAHDCGVLPHTIMSSMTETLLRNTNDGVRTNFGCYQQFYYDAVHPNLRGETYEPAVKPDHQAWYRPRS
ncbi:hypothetical protein [Stenotrophomonas phage BUCTxx99]|nr:hypothetical protein [Stenotrophomonas phage BUCTxx99]